MARRCKNCGEKLFPTDTFCGFCGEPAELTSEGMESFSYTPRSLVGDEALTKKERDAIEYAKRRFLQEAAAETASGKNEEKIKEQARARAKQLEQERLEEEKREEERKAAELAAAAEKAEKARIEAEKAAEEAARLEAERKAAEEAEAARLEAERKAAEEAEATRLEAERKAAEEAEAARLEAERKAAEEAEAARLEAERKAAEEAARLEQERIAAEEAELLRLEEERRASEERAARAMEEAARYEAERKAAEEEEAARLEAERLAAKEAARLEAENQIEEESEESLPETDKQLEEQKRPDSLREDSETDIISTDKDSGTAENKMPAEQEDFGDEDEGFLAESLIASKVTATEPEERKDMAQLWEEAERRAAEEQREADIQKRKRRASEPPKHLNRDLILLSVGIVVLILLMVFMLKSEMNSVKGNDLSIKEGNNVATGSGAAGQTQTGAEGANTPSGEKLPSDYRTVWDGTAASSFAEGDGTSDNPYRINAGSELAYLASEVNRGVNFSGIYFSLETDLDLAGLEWTPIGYYYRDQEKGDLVYSFNGIFNGNGHKIFNYKICTLENAVNLPNYSANKVCGLFGTTFNAAVSNLTVEKCTLDISEDGEGEIVAGALIGCAYDTQISDCTVSADVKLNAKGRAIAGVLAGAINNGEVKAVNVSGSVANVNSVGINDAGLVAGYAKGGSFENTLADGTVSSVGANNIYCGGAIGYGSEITVNGLKVNSKTEALCQTINEQPEGGEESVNIMAGGAIGYYVSGNDKSVNATGELTATGIGTVYAGGAFAYAKECVSDSVSSGVTATASTSGSKAYVISGGVYGYFSNSTLSNGNVSGSINSSAPDTNYSGGVVGYADIGGLTELKVSTAVTASASSKESATVMCGGVSGNIKSVSMTGVEATGSVTADSGYDAYTGGVSGYIKDGDFKNVSASGKISNKSASGVSNGGFAGYAEGKYTTEECTGSKDRSSDGKNVYDEDFIAIKSEE